MLEGRSSLIILKFKTDAGLLTNDLQQISCIALVGYFFSRLFLQQLCRQIIFCGKLAMYLWELKRAVYHRLHHCMTTNSMLVFSIYTLSLQSDSVTD